MSASQLVGKHLDGLALDGGDVLVALLGKFASKMFICGVPMKPATKRLAGWLKTSYGVPICWMNAVAHDDDEVAERHGLDLVVGNVDEGGVDLLAQLDDLSAHLVAELGVEVGQRLIHQEDLRVPDDGAADGDTLPLAAGQGLLGLRVEVQLIPLTGGFTDRAARSSP